MFLILILLVGDFVIREEILTELDMHPPQDFLYLDEGVYLKKGHTIAKFDHQGNLENIYANKGDGPLTFNGGGIFDSGDGIWAMDIIGRRAVIFDYDLEPVRDISVDTGRNIRNIHHLGDQLLYLEHINRKRLAFVIFDKNISEVKEQNALDIPTENRPGYAISQVEKYSVLVYDKRVHSDRYNIFICNIKSSQCNSFGHIVPEYEAFLKSRTRSFQKPGISSVAKIGSQYIVQVSVMVRPYEEYRGEAFDYWWHFFDAQTLKPIRTMRAKGYLIGSRSISQRELYYDEKSEHILLLEDLLNSK